MKERPDETLAGRTLELLLDAPFEVLDGAGAPESTVDLVIHQDDGDRFVEVTQAMNEDAKRLSARIKRKDFAYGGSATWWVHIHHDADLDLLESRLPALLQSLEGGSEGRFVDEDLGALRVASAYRHPVSTGEGSITVTPAARSGLDAHGAVAAVQAELDKQDNQRKLAAVGGGDLFVWMDVNQPDVFFGASGLAPQLGEVILPEAIRTVWMAIMLPVSAADGRHERAALNVQSFTPEGGWINWGDPLDAAHPTGAVSPAPDGKCQ